GSLSVVGTCVRKRSRDCRSGADREDHPSRATQAGGNKHNAPSPLATQACKGRRQLTAERRALVVGATGLVGARCVMHLLNDKSYGSVTGLFPRPFGRSHPKLRECLVNFDALGELEAIDDVFCALGTTMKKAGSREAFRKVDFELPLAIAERAKA